MSGGKVFLSLENLGTLEVSYLGGKFLYRTGDYREGRGITHVNILRTLEAMYGLSKAGAQQPNAAGGGISDNYIITDVFKAAR